MISLKKEKINRNKNNFERIRANNIADITGLTDRSENNYDRKEKGIPTPNIKQKKKRKNAHAAYVNYSKKKIRKMSMKLKI